uniref:Calpain catalytic domain-containing protein n=1 Tax=Steinernema glaseri TaxID=37863 RepID=A0A1I7ZVS7_9BILA
MDPTYNLSHSRNLEVNSTYSLYLTSGHHGKLQTSPSGVFHIYSKGDVELPAADHRPGDSFVEKERRYRPMSTDTIVSSLQPGLTRDSLRSAKTDSRASRGERQQPHLAYTIVSSLQTGLTRDSLRSAKTDSPSRGERQQPHLARKHLTAYQAHCSYQYGFQKPMSESRTPSRSSNGDGGFISDAFTTDASTSSGRAFDFGRRLKAKLPKVLQNPSEFVFNDLRTASKSCREEASAYQAHCSYQYGFQKPMSESRTPSRSSNGDGGFISDAFTTEASTSSGRAFDFGRRLKAKLPKVLQNPMASLSSVVDLVDSALAPVVYRENYYNGAAVLPRIDFATLPLQPMFWRCRKCGLEQLFAPTSPKCPICGHAVAKSITGCHYVAKGDVQMINEALTSQKNCLTSDQLEEKDEREAKKIYNRVVAFCREYQTTFIDDGFPHSERAIGDFNRLGDAARIGSRLREVPSIVWLRPTQMYTKDGRKFMWTVFKDTQPTDIEQGLLGNCWFLSALAVIAERPDILEKIVLTKVYNKDGVYMIRLCVDGLWKVVVLDDFFPCYSTNNSMVFSVGRRNQLWVPLIEKALAKQLGNYVALRAGRSLEGLAYLTGAPCVLLDIEDQSLDKDIVWATLLSSREANFLMGCSCGAGLKTVDENEFKSVGLVSQHAYSLLDVRQVGTNRLVRLRNPWGRFVWKGPWSEGCPRWTPALRKQLNPNGVEAGTFWMSFEDFYKYFDSVDIAKVRYGWSETRLQLNVRGQWGAGNSEAVRILVERPTENDIMVLVHRQGATGDSVGELVIRSPRKVAGFRPTEVCFTLYQCGSRVHLNPNDIMVLVHRQGATGDSVGELVIRSPRKVAGFVSTGDVFLAPGVYYACVFSFSQFNSSNDVNCVLAVHSSKDILSHIIHVSPHMFADSLAELLLKEGKMHTTLQGCVTRYIAENFGGLILMAENLHEHRVIRVRTDCQESGNVLSTRAGFLAMDVIPPMHRQILMLLTQCEMSQKYWVKHLVQLQTSTIPQLNEWTPEEPYAQHVPRFDNPTTAFLHAPRPIFM